MSDNVVPDYIEHSARMQAEHYRKVAARFRLQGCGPLPVDGRYRTLGQRAAASAVAGCAA